MRHLQLLLALILLPLSVSAYHFERDGIYYNITSEAEKTVEVTWLIGGEDNGIAYSGDVVIPSTVTNNSKEYSVTGIGGAAFRNCSSLTSVIVPEGVTRIGEYAFVNCSNLSSINIPEDVTTIGWSAFDGCSSLNSIHIPEGVTSIESYTFYDCGKLTSVNIPNTVTIIKYNAFGDCSSLTSVKIGSSVESIEGNAFAGCSSLTSVTIPESVKNIEGYAFGYSTKLNTIYCRATTPPTLNNTFSDYNATLYVPVGTKDSYASAEEWKNFTNIVDAVYVEISPIGYTSFASKHSVDFSGQEGFTAYIGKYDDAANTLTLIEVTDAPAETGLVLKGEAGKTYALAVPVTTTTTDKGDLKAVIEDTQVDATMKNYVLSQVDGEIGFYRYTGTTIAAGRSYLELPAATNARAITLSFDNTTTGISSLNAATTEAQPKVYYNLSGQRVAKPTKGLYIIGGKKVVVK